MKLTILGCDGTFPSANGACSGYLVEAGGKQVLLDLGSAVLSRLMAKTRPENLAAVCLTHWHNDHVSDMLALKYYLLIHHFSLPVMTPMDENPLKDYLAGPEFDYLDIREGRVIGGISLSACPVSHPMPAYAVKLAYGGRTLVYTGDAAGGESLVPFCRGVDLLVCDASFTLAQWHKELPHFSAAMAARVAREAGVGRLVITHAQPGSDRDALLREARDVFPDTIPAEPGLILEV